MKKIFLRTLALSVFAVLAVSCCRCKCRCNECTCNHSCNQAQESTVSNTPSSSQDEIIMFDGKTLNGWRGYNRQDVPQAWIVEDGAIRLKGSGRGEAGARNGGDIIYDQKFSNFEFSFEWKVAKGSNSGVFYLAQEVPGKPIFFSSPEFQILDNENHPDARMGENGNRQSASLYDMIPASPQNAKPYGQWNTSKIIVYKGTVVHYQNGKNVLEYHLWTPEWKAMLDKCKFSEDKRPDAYKLLLNCGGENKEGYIGFQDHGDDVWFRNIKIKKL